MAYSHTYACRLPFADHPESKSSRHVDRASLSRTVKRLAKRRYPLPVGRIPDSWRGSAFRNLTQHCYHRFHGYCAISDTATEQGGMGVRTGNAKRIPRVGSASIFVSVPVHEGGIAPDGLTSGACRTVDRTSCLNRRTLTFAIRRCFVVAGGFPPARSKLVGEGLGGTSTGSPAGTRATTTSRRRSDLAGHLPHRNCPPETRRQASRLQLCTHPDRETASR